MCLWMFMDGMIGMYKIWLDIGDLHGCVCWRVNLIGLICSLKLFDSEHPKTIFTTKGNDFENSTISEHPHDIHHRKTILEEAHVEEDRKGTTSSNHHFLGFHVSFCSEGWKTATT